MDTDNIVVLGTYNLPYNNNKLYLYYSSRDKQYFVFSHDTLAPFPRKEMAMKFIKLYLHSLVDEI